MVKCFVFGCETGSLREKREGVQLVPFFSPPTDPALFKKWKAVIPRREKKLKREDKVCALHFTQDMIIDCDVFEVDGEVHTFKKRARLVNDACPCIFPIVSTDAMSKQSTSNSRIENSMPVIEPKKSTQQYLSAEIIKQELDSNSEESDDPPRAMPSPPLLSPLREKPLYTYTRKKMQNVHSDGSNVLVDNIHSNTHADEADKSGIACSDTRTSSRTEEMESPLSCKEVNFICKEIILPSNLWKQSPSQPEKSLCTYSRKTVTSVSRSFLTVGLHSNVQAEEAEKTDIANSDNGTGSETGKMEASLSVTVPCSRSEETQGPMSYEEIKLIFKEILLPTKFWARHSNGSESFIIFSHITVNSVNDEVIMDKYVMYSSKNMIACRPNVFLRGVKVSVCNQTVQSRFEIERLLRMVDNLKVCAGAFDRKNKPRYSPYCKGYVYLRRLQRCNECKKLHKATYQQEYRQKQAELVLQNNLSTMKEIMQNEQSINKQVSKITAKVDVLAMLQ